jgi:hypothetical protein
MVMFPIGSTGSYASTKAIMTPSVQIHGRRNAQDGKELEEEMQNKTKQNKRRRRRGNQRLRTCKSGGKIAAHDDEQDEPFHRH